jgi:hypothetical protein
MDVLIFYRESAWCTKRGRPMEEEFRLLVDKGKTESGVG